MSLQTLLWSTLVSCNSLFLDEMCFVNLDAQFHAHINFRQFIGSGGVWSCCQDFFTTAIESVHFGPPNQRICPNFPYRSFSVPDQCIFHHFINFSPRKADPTVQQLHQLGPPCTLGVRFWKSDGQEPDFTALRCQSCGKISCRNRIVCAKHYLCEVCSSLID